MHVFPDVIVQPNGEDQWIAVGRDFAAAGETFVIEIGPSGPDHGGPRQRFPVRTIDSRPVIIDGGLRHRIRLQRDPLASACSGSKSDAAGATRRPGSPAALTREFLVRVLNMSGSGGLVESHRRLEVGTIGRLQLQLETGDYGDDVEVVRCQRSGVGHSLYDVGLRFLPTTPVHAGSIRYAVALHAGEVNVMATTLA